MTAQQLIAGMQRLSRYLAESFAQPPAEPDTCDWCDRPFDPCKPRYAMNECVYCQPACRELAHEDDEPTAFAMDDCGLCVSLRMGEAS